jgi:UDP-glucose 4-epimerase
LILITGGAGYIGSHLVRELGAEGVVVLDDLSRGHEWALQGAALVRGCVTDGAALRAAFEKYPIRSVVHFAGRIEAGLSVTEPLAFWRANVGGTLTLLEEMTRAGVGTIVFSSSAAVYGEPERVPIDEEHPLRPESPYGETKLATERVIRDWARAHGGRFAALRYFNAAGAHLSAEIGEAHEPETHLIPLVLDVAAGRRESISVFGDDYATRDGTCIRDYVHVSDLAAAHLLALQHLEAGGGSGAFNLGSGEGFTVLEVVRTAERVTGRPIAVRLAPRREGDPAVLVASAQRAREQLLWSPRWPQLEPIVESAWRWHRRRSEE